MSFFLRLRPSQEAKSSPPVNFDILPSPPECPLDSWYLQPHDRETLQRRVMPYMAVSLQKSYQLQTVRRQHTWAGEMIQAYIGRGPPARCDPAWFHQTVTAFWTDPTTLVKHLLELTRIWFFILLRYTYRKHFSWGRDLSRSNLDERDFCAEYSYDYSSALSEDEISRLTRQKNKYGATYYRKSYKDTEKRIEWRTFCERVRSFCQLIGLHTSSKNPERNIQDLHSSLTSIILCHQIQITSAQHTAVLHKLGKRVRKMDERMASGAVHNQGVVRNLERELQDMTRAIEELEQKFPQADEVLRKDVEITELKALRVAHENSLRGIDQDLKEIRNDFDRVHTQAETCLTADKLVLCRWLLEHLPTNNVTQDRLGYYWRQFWTIQWEQCKKKKRASHPLWGLVGDEKFYSVGKALYGTLSDRLHKYGHQRGENLSPYTQRVVDVIGPVHYDVDGKIDLEAERRRWTD